MPERSGNFVRLREFWKWVLHRQDPLAEVRPRAYIVERADCYLSMNVVICTEGPIELTKPPEASGA